MRAAAVQNLDARPLARHSKAKWPGSCKGMGKTALLKVHASIGRDQCACSRRGKAALLPIFSRGHRCPTHARRFLWYQVASCRTGFGRLVMWPGVQRSRSRGETASLVSKIADFGHIMNAQVRLRGKARTPFSAHCEAPPNFRIAAR